MNENNIKNVSIEEDVKMKENEILEKIEDLVDEYNECIRTTDPKENAIEWYNGDETITITLSQRRFINKINNLAKLYPDEVRIDKINEDGTMLAHIPLSYLKIQKPRVMSEEEKEKARERLAQYRKNGNKEEDNN